MKMKNANAGKALLLVVVSFCLFLLPIAALRSSVTSCFVYNRNVLDLSFTYNFNKARIAAHVIVGNDHGSVTIFSKSISDFSDAANRTALLIGFLDGGQCDLVVSIDPNSWADVDISRIASMYPSIQFVENSAERLLRSKVSASNYAAFTFDVDTQFFAAGYLAGKQASKCVGAVYGNSPKTIVTSFFHGLQHSGSTASLIAINVSTKNSALLVDLFGQAGCEVVFGMADETLVYPGLVATASEKYSIMSIGLGNDASTIYGDSVLTSVYYDLTSLFANMTAQVVEEKPFSIDSVIKEGIFAPLSTAARSSDFPPALQDGLCGATWTDKSGTVHTECPTLLQRLDFSAVDSRIDFRPALADPQYCPPGTYTSYNMSTFELSCPACQEGTFAASRGSAACSPCDAGLVAAAGSSACEPPEVVSKSWIIVVAVLVPLFVVILVVSLICLFNRSGTDKSRDSSIAPRGPTVVLGMLGVDQTVSSKKWRSSLSRMCGVYDKIYFLVSSCATSNGVYVFTSVGDIVMVAASTEHQILSFFAAVSAEAAVTQWGCDVVLKFAMHTGTPSVLVNEQANADNARVAYTGPDVELLRLLWKVESKCLVTASMSCTGGGEAGAPAAVFTQQAHDAEQNIPFKGIIAYGKWRLEQSKPGSPATTAEQNASSAKKDEFSGSPPKTQKSEENVEVAEDDDEEPEKEVASNPLSRHSQSSDNRDETDLDGLLDPPSLGKQQIEAIRGLCVDFIQKLLMVMQFEEQVSLVSHVATALHIPKPTISSTATRKKSSNMLRPCTRLICQQLLATVDENEMLKWIAGLKEEDGAQAGSR
jgi:hypothetical protein